ncbi:4a-hydroxytetrahydrobiopterin dehydratase [Nitrogeniibacter aestuarii]|uniref:4a-hydroxytetrahydrobiopterin dehydratase n=1 Tax=Nitrogeniibacter aestuarii TaxID=2815343 RepID=UPI001D100389|nr:4a-hydroxytetrahydrobiopterin dehydratase [Nitrogeniibacter aestuarii]
MSKKLTDGVLMQNLSGLEGWKLNDDKTAISRSFKFADFNAAFGFMTRIALKAEQLDHHPDWHNVYNTVDITLSTHDVGGLSDKDIVMARFVSALAG